MTTAQEIGRRQDVLSVLKDAAGGLTVVQIAETLDGADWYEVLAALRGLIDEGYDIWQFQGLGGNCAFTGIEYTLNA